jgi:pimeloyl-ACP methyl ester carboxylesterase
MTMRDETITLRDKRALAFTDLGADGRDAPVVVYLHGAPTSRLDLVDADADLAASGVRVLCPDRPGYGRSSPLPGRSMADHASDIAALADRLGIGSFGVVGLSSGGPYAVACAATLGSRVTTAAVVAGATDFSWPGAWDGYVEDECEMMRLPDEEAAVQWCETRYGRDGMGFVRGFLPDVDVDATVASGAARGFTASIIEAFRQGVGGYGQDVWVQGQPWPFDPASIAAPMYVFHGDADPIVPVAHAEHTASRIPGAKLQIWPGETHSGAAARTAAVITSLFG